MATVPTLAPAPRHPVAAQDTAAITELASQIADPARERPIVVLTPRNGHDTPYFPASWVLEVVEHHADVVAINHSRESGLTAELDRLLPVGLGVLNGAARIYWPFKRVGRSHHAHPLVLADREATPGPEKRHQLQSRWTAGPDAAPMPPAAPPPPAATAPIRARPVRQAAPAPTPSPGATAWPAPTSPSTTGSRPPAR